MFDRERDGKRMSGGGREGERERVREEESGEGREGGGHERDGGGKQREREGSRGRGKGGTQRDINVECSCVLPISIGCCRHSPTLSVVPGRSLPSSMKTSCVLSS